MVGVIDRNTAYTKLDMIKCKAMQTNTIITTALIRLLETIFIQHAIKQIYYCSLHGLFPLSAMMFWWMIGALKSARIHFKSAWLCIG